MCGRWREADTELKQKPNVGKNSKRTSLSIEALCVGDAMIVWYSSIIPGYTCRLSDNMWKDMESHVVGTSKDT